MFDDVSFDSSNDKLVWGSVFTGFGFTLGMSCLVLRCLYLKCRSRRRQRRPIVKTLNETDSDSDSDSDESQTSTEMTSETGSGAGTADAVAVDMERCPPDSGAGVLFWPKKA